jgi:hypothetical protein
LTTDHAEALVLSLGKKDQAGLLGEKKVALTKLFLDMFQIVTTYFQIFSTSPSSRSHQQLADIRYHQKIVVFFFGSQWDPMVGLCHKPLKRCDFVRPRSSPRNVRRAHR